MLTDNYQPNIVEASARLIALHTALECPSEPTSPEDVANAELIRLIAFEPDNLADCIVLSTKILHERDFAWGTHPGVIYDADSLAEHFGADLRTTVSAIKLCGGRQINGGWRDHPKASFVLDADSIKVANEHAAGWGQRVASA